MFGGSLKNFEGSFSKLNITEDALFSLQFIAHFGLQTAATRGPHKASGGHFWTKSVRMEAKEKQLTLRVDPISCLYPYMTKEKNFSELSLQGRWEHKTIPACLKHMKGSMQTLEQCMRACVVSSFLHQRFMFLGFLKAEPGGNNEAQSRTSCNCALQIGKFLRRCQMGLEGSFPLLQLFVLCILVSLSCLSFAFLLCCFIFGPAQLTVICRNMHWDFHCDLVCVDLYQTRKSGP